MSTYLTKTFKTLRPWSSIVNGHLYDLSIHSARGSYFIDKNNKKIIDFTSGQMVSNLGYNNNTINKKMKNAIESGLLYSPYAFLTNEREIYSSRLIEETGINNGKVFYTTGGGESNESACYFAKSYFSKTPQKNKILTFEKSFHGASSYLASYISGDSRLSPRRQLYNNKLLQNAIMKNPSLNDNGEKSLDSIKTIFKESHNDIAAILIEGSSGTMGCHVYPPGYFVELVQTAKKHNILVIVDEVMSGFGRTGKMFAYQHYSEKPDMITMAKGITNGLIPMGSVVLSEKITVQYKYKPVVNGLTYSGHNFSCAIANACLDEYQTDEYSILNNVVKNELILIGKLKFLKRTYPSLIKSFRGKGLLYCIEFKDEEIANKIALSLIKNNVYIFSRGQFLFISPPLIITKNELEETLEKLRISLFSYFLT
jgi:taurine---2-oxoglutarate transaminase